MPVSKLTPKKKSKMVGLLVSPTRLLSTPSRDDYVTNKDDDDTSVATIVTATPKMNVLFGGNSTILLGYFVSIEFFDKQAEFNTTFGLNPVMLPLHPNSVDGTATDKSFSISVNNASLMYIYMHVGNHMLAILQSTRIQL